MYIKDLLLPAVLAPTTILATIASATPDQVTNQVIVVSGDQAPDGNGDFFSFSDPILNDLGEIAFIGSLVGTTGGSSDNSGVFLGNSTSSPTQVARAGEAAPDGNGIFQYFQDPALNDAGQVVFFGNLTQTSGLIDRQGIFRGDSSASPVQIARGGDDAPDNDGSFFDVGPPTINNSGQTVFDSFLSDTSDNQRVYRGDGSSSLSQLARAGDSAPDGYGSFVSFSPPTLNDAGESAYVGTLTGTSQTEGIFRSNGTSSYVQIARVGQAAPDSDGSFSSFGPPALNEAGQAAFFGELTGTSNSVGIYLGDGTGSLVQVSRAGQVAPDGNGNFIGYDSLSLNDAGQTAFLAELINTSGDDSDNSGVFRDDGVGSLISIAREGDVAPDGNGKFSGFVNPALNNAGQTAFVATLIDTDGGSSDDRGLYLYDDTHGLQQVVRKGDPLLDSTITDIGFSEAADHYGDERSGLNQQGQIAYRFFLADGRIGLAIASELLPGDYNYDGVVNLADYTVWRDLLGAPAGSLPNDSSDSAIGTAQYVNWKENFGANRLSETSTVFASTVPEPTALLVVFGGVGLLIPALCKRYRLTVAVI